MANLAEKYVEAIELIIGSRNGNDPVRTFSELKAIDLVAKYDAELKADSEAKNEYDKCFNSALKLLDREYEVALSKLRANLKANLAA